MDPKLDEKQNMKWSVQLGETRISLQTAECGPIEKQTNKQTHTNHNALDHNETNTSVQYIYLFEEFFDNYQVGIFFPVGMFFRFS